MKKMECKYVPHGFLVYLQSTLNWEVCILTGNANPCQQPELFKSAFMPQSSSPRLWPPPAHGSPGTQQDNPSRLGGKTSQNGSCFHKRTGRPCAPPQSGQGLQELPKENRGWRREGRHPDQTLASFVWNKEKSYSDTKLIKIEENCRTIDNCS